MNPQHIVYLALVLLAIGITLCAIDPMSPNSIRVVKDYCGMNDRIGECLWAVLTKGQESSLNDNISHDWFGIGLATDTNVARNQNGTWVIEAKTLISKVYGVEDGNIVNMTNTYNTNSGTLVEYTSYNIGHNISFTHTADEWFEFVITYDGKTNNEYVDTGLTMGTIEHEYASLDDWGIRSWYAEYRGIA